MQRQIAELGGTAAAETVEFENIEQAIVSSQAICRRLIPGSDRLRAIAGETAVAEPESSGACAWEELPAAAEEGKRTAGGQAGEPAAERGDG